MSVHSYTYRNHLRMGFGKDYAEYSESQPFRVRIGELSRKPDLPFIEAQRAARLIGARVSDPRLCLSGGLDSEAMALAFLAADVPFEAAVLRFEHGLNEQDILHAISFCERHAIRMHFVDLDVEAVYESGQHLGYVRAYRTDSPERAIHLIFLEKIMGSPIMAGEIFRPETIDGRVLFLMPNDRDFSCYRYLKAWGRAGVPDFHFYTPELIYSFLAHTDVAKPDAVATDWKGRPEEFYLYKLGIYRQGGFPIQENPGRTRKYHGFEGVKRYFDEKHGDFNAYDRIYREPVRSRALSASRQELIIGKNDGIAKDLLSVGLSHCHPSGTGSLLWALK